MIYCLDDFLAIRPYRASFFAVFLHCTLCPHKVYVCKSLLEHFSVEVQERILPCNFNNFAPNLVTTLNTKK